MPDAYEHKPNEVDAALSKLPVVGIGASAGGIKALQTLFEALPAGLGAAFVVIVHLDPEKRSELSPILSAHSAFSVEQVAGTSRLKPDHVYVIPPDRRLRISDHEVSAVPFDEPRGRRAPIDLFFRSLAELGSDSFAVVLTGAGSDGAVGVRAIKETGGIVLVQDPAEAEYPSMPRSAIATDSADVVLPIRQLAERLVELIQIRREGKRLPRHHEVDDFVRRILAHLRARTGHDFSRYKGSTVYRRLLRRLQVARADSFQDYFKYLRENAEESQALMADLLISVTTFFRDPAAFESLAGKVIPHLIDKTHPTGIRVWIPGCATGEEAYSIAMLLLEESGRREVRPEIQVFASDLDLNALATAREGRYPAAIHADLSDERLRRFFTEDGEYYRVKRELRDIVLFANHSLLKDPPFSKLDLISCRNLLIYLDREMQQQVLNTLHYGLNEDGYLFLGSSEIADHPSGYFRVVDREARIFQSLGRRRDQLPALPQRLLPPGIEPAVTQDGRARGARGGPYAMHRQALEAAAPPSIVVDNTSRIIHLSETAGRFLQPQGGILSADVTELVRDELRLELRSALHHVFEHAEPILSAAIFVQFNGTPRRVYLQVQPVHPRDREQRPEQALILFVEAGPEDHLVAGADGMEDQPENEIVRKLRQELELVQARLRTTREESESANEELRAANEELQSINEEYRSTAEELETSREELQSINEELQTVNSELKSKLEAVSRAHTDLQYLMAATDVGTLFLDAELRINRFTPRIADLFSISANDVGRPITDFTHRLEYDGLFADAHRVLDQLTPIEREVRSRDGIWYVLRLRPYRAPDNKIEGVVVTFVDMTERRRMEDALRASESQLKQEMRLVELSRSPIFVWDFDDGIVKWNRGSEELYGYSRDQAQGKVKDDLLKTTVPGSSFEVVRKALLERGTWNGELRQVARDGRRLIVDSHIELVPVEGRRYVLESTRDITDSKALMERQQLLVSELTHRVKNLLTVVQGMVHQTAKRSSSIDAFVRKLDGRLTALADSQKLLVDSVWGGADLQQLIERQLAPYVGENRSRVKLDGEMVVLPADIATPFGLVLHELATNAAKYGALSEEKGLVELSWQAVDGNNGRTLKVLWKERDGPPVRPPASTGFGSQLIKQGLASANVQYEFHSQGIECAIELVLPVPSWSG
ncbi:MAG TPA: chemotaxis protein CheB [Rhizomicrobium sp.]|jgi:two-component system CheB/CheR fusion protein|nr:chemotaxis protein CheB [Rhizomicrobium sp.]